MKYLSRFLPIALVCLASFKPVEMANNEAHKNPLNDPKITAANAKVSMDLKIQNTYSNLNVQNYGAPSLECFSKALKGYFQLKSQGIITNDKLTIIDFSLSSTKKRLWVIDMEKNEVLIHSLVSHGLKSGGEFATNFSNILESNKSSLGFYLTGETYQGKHGLSLKLDGLEKGFNDKARDRAVVIHGADYVSERFIRQQGRLGRSLGCPAVPMEIHQNLINTIKENSCLFIYHPSRIVNEVSEPFAS